MGSMEDLVSKIPWLPLSLPSSFNSVNHYLVLEGREAFALFISYSFKHFVSDLPRLLKCKNQTQSVFLFCSPYSIVVNAPAVWGALHAQ